MCLYVKGGPFTAKKDFYTIKMMHDPIHRTVYSPFQRFKYTLNKLYKTKNLKPQELFWSKGKKIEEGFHSILVGHRSKWLTAYRWDNYYQEKAIVICKIPKGSIYYLGSYNDVVSNNISIIEIIATNNVSNFQFKEDTQTEYWKTAGHGLSSITNYIKSLGLNIKPS